MSTRWIWTLGLVLVFSTATTVLPQYHCQNINNECAFGQFDCDEFVEFWIYTKDQKLAILKASLDCWDGNWKATCQLESWLSSPVIHCVTLLLVHSYDWCRPMFRVLRSYNCVHYRVFDSSSLYREFNNNDLNNVKWASCDWNGGLSVRKQQRLRILHVTYCPWRDATWQLLPCKLHFDYASFLQCTTRLLITFWIMQTLCAINVKNTVYFKL